MLNLINQSGVRLAHLHMQDNKLFLEGAAGAEQIKNRIWDQIKQVNPAGGRQHLRPNSRSVGSSRAFPKGKKTYTVAAGDSLSKIAKHVYGNANQYMKIFEANKDKISDPDKIRVGQELIIPD